MTPRLTRWLGDPLRRRVTVGATCAASAVGATWPVAAHLGTSVPLGTEGAGTIPLFSLWQLWWTANRLGHGFRHYLDAPIFHPNKGVASYSEPMPLLGSLVAPLWKLGASPALIYNVALLAVLILNGVFCYRLLRALRMSPALAIFGAMLAVQLPFVTKVMGVLPNVALFGMFWTLDGLVRFGREGSTRWAAWGCAGFAATLLSFQQYALFFIPLAVAAGFVALGEQRFRRAPVVRLLGCGAAAGLLLLVLALPTLHVHANLGFVRSERLVQALSAHPADFLTRPASGLVGVPRVDRQTTAGLFPGVLLGGLAVLGATTRLGGGEGSRRWVVFFVAGSLVGALLALGLNLRVFGWRPFDVVRSLPGMAQVRGPWRAAAIFQLCLVPLAAYGLLALRRSVRLGTVAVVAVAALAVAENFSATPLLRLPSSSRTAWAAWVRDQPEGSVVTHVPFPGGLTVGAYESEAWRMFAQTYHQAPMVNGYSGYFPVAKAADGSVVQAYTRFQAEMVASFPSEPTLCVLTRSLGSDLLVVDRSWLTEHEPDMAAVNAFLVPAYEDSQVRIYRMAAPGDVCRAYG